LQQWKGIAVARGKMAHKKKTKMRTAFKQYIQGKRGACVLVGNSVYIRKKSQPFLIRVMSSTRIKTLN